MTIDQTSIKPGVDGFYFKVPEVSEDLSRAARVALVMGAMASRLALEERTRLFHPDGRAENVAEHSLMLVKVATRLAQLFYPHLDAGMVAIYAADHDDVEAYVLDTPTDRITDHGRLEKAEREALGLAQLVDEYGAIVPSYARDVAEYEAQTDPHARFVRVVDKLLVLLVHATNKGDTLRKECPVEEYFSNTHATAARLKAEYPEYEDLIDLRTELAYYIAATYMTDDM